MNSSCLSLQFAFPHHVKKKNKVKEDIHTWEIFGEILPPVLLLDELLVDVLVDLVPLLQMLALVLHRNPTDEAVKQL